jgi:hypothetical protein
MDIASLSILSEAKQPAKALEHNFAAIWAVPELPPRAPGLLRASRTGARAAGGRGAERSGLQRGEDGFGLTMYATGRAAPRPWRGGIWLVISKYYNNIKS